MKPMNTLKVFSLAILASLFIVSCSNRATTIPTIISNLQTAMSNQSLSDFKKDIWSSAADKTLMDSGTFSMSNLVYSAGIKYNYVFGSLTIPETGKEITVKATSTKITPGNTTGEAKFEMIDVSAIPFTEDWKIKKIYLPGVTDPVVKVPDFIQFAPAK